MAQDDMQLPPPTSFAGHAVVLSRPLLGMTGLSAASRYKRVNAHGLAIASLFLISACPPATAGEMAEFFDNFAHVASEGETSHILDIDNDSLLLRRDDGFYSSGLRYTQQYATRTNGAVTTYGWRLGQELYTASDIKVAPDRIAAQDHPYAGWLYGGVFKQAIGSNGAAWKWGVDVGCLGPCAGGEWVQTNLHRLLDQPLPQGWAKQVRTELGLVLYGERVLTPIQWASWMELTPQVHGRFGNIFTDAGAGLMLRMGQLNKAGQESTFHGYLRIEGRAVGYNATLQGGYFSRNNPHTVEPKRWVGEAEAGIVWNINPYAVRASVVRRSNEIRTLPSSQGSQNFASLQFSYSR